LCFDDLDPLGAEASERQSLAQDLYHRLITPRGRILDDAEFGLDVRAWLSGDFPANAGALIEEEMLKDQRVASASVTVSKPNPDAFTIQVAIETDDDAFALTVDVSTAGTSAQVAS
jgi:hypothetical protein